MSIGRKGEKRTDRPLWSIGAGDHLRFGPTILLLWVVALALFTVAPPILSAELPLSVTLSLANSGDTMTVPEQEFLFTNSSNDSIVTNKNKEDTFPKSSSLQIPFIENQGQIESTNVKYYAKTLGGTLFVTKKGELVYSLPNRQKGENVVKGWVIKENFVGGLITHPEGVERSITNVNYIRGKDSSKWRRAVSTYNKVSCGEVYKDIELQLKAYGNNVEKLFYVKPGANPETIKVKISGAKSIKVNEEEELEVVTGLGVVKFTRPVAFQEENYKRKYVEVAYVVNGDKYSFKVGDYDRTRELVIDPLLASTFLGPGDGPEFFGSDLFIGSSEYLYIVDSTNSLTFPVTTGAFDTSYNGGTDVFVSKLDSNLENLLASTFVGGSGVERASSINIDNSGNVYIAGYTDSQDFPTTSGAYDITYNGNRDTYVFKLDGNLENLLASTFLGGSGDDSSSRNQVSVGSNGDVFVSGTTASSDFPITPTAYDSTFNGSKDVFVSMLDSDLQNLLASTYLGGSSEDNAGDLLIDINGNVYVSGATYGSNFPTTPGAYDTTPNGSRDAFISKLNGNLQSLLASTLLGGGSYDAALGLLMDINGDVYVSGFAYGNGFPITSGAYDTTYNGVMDVFVAKFDSSLENLLASTFLGGPYNEGSDSISIDNSGNIYISGFTYSSNFPTTPNAYDLTANGNDDAFISKLNGNLDTLLASTFLGGSAEENYGGGTVFSSVHVGGTGNIYVVGWTRSSDFPTTPGAYDTTYNGSADIFVSKFDSDLTAQVAGPILQTPAQNSTIPTSTITFDWSDVPDAVSYEIWVDNDQAFGSPEVHEPEIHIPSLTDSFYEVTNWLPDGVYYWKVIAHFADSSQAESETWSFTYQLPSDSSPVWVPFYRLYKGGGTGRDHFYTTNAWERDNAVDSGEGWTYERVECSISDRNAPSMVPLFRLYYNDGVNEDHFYTTDETEKDNAIANDGYDYEGIAGFIYSSPTGGSVALYRLYNTGDVNHFYCTRTSEQQHAMTTWLFVDEGIEGYVMPAEAPDPLSGGRPSGHDGPFNTAVGAYLYSWTDVSLPSPGPAIRFTRYYNSRSTNEGILGVGWTHSYDWHIYENKNEYVVHRGDGRMDYYDLTTLQPLYGGVYNTLSKNGDIITLTRPDKTDYIFEYLTSDPEVRKNGFFLKEITDRYGNTLTLTYDSLGRLIKVTDPVNRYIDLTYDADAADHLFSITDPQLTRSLYFQVNADTKNLEWSRDWKGNQTNYDYKTDAQSGVTHRIDSIIRPGNKTLVTIEYDGEGRLSKQTDAFVGNDTLYTYDSNGTHVTDPLGNIKSYDNNSLYELTTMTDALGSNEFSNYDNDHEQADFTDRLGNNSTFQYNGVGGITDLTHYIENGDTIISNYQYLNTSFPAFATSYTDPMSMTTNYEYDLNGNLTTTTDPVSNTISRTHYPNGQLESLTDKNNRTTYYYYEDAWKNLTRVVDPLGGETVYSYDAVGRRISARNPRGFTTYYEYDLNDNLTKDTDPLNNQTTYEYDENNNVTKIIDANIHETTFIYDLKDRLLTETDANGHTVSYSYDALGRRTSVTDENDKSTGFQYDGNGNLIQVNTPLTTIQYEYDANGNLTKIIDGRGKAVQNTYDYMDQLADTQNPLTLTTYYSYWKDGNLFSRQDPKGDRTEYFYDALGRLSSIAYSDGTGVTFEYDNKGNLTKMIDSIGDTTYTYDENDRLLSVLDPFGKTVSYTYDVSGNRESITYPGSKTVLYEYDALNRLIKVTDWLGGVTTYQYDPAGSLVQTDNPNGTQTVYFYDPADRLTGLSNTKSDGSVICSYSYTLDNVGNITDVVLNEPLVPIYQTTSASYTYDDANRLVSDGDYDYTYDNNGNLTQRSKTGDVTTFAYDLDNMLISISGASNIVNDYNGAGQRILRTVNGTETRYVLDVAAYLLGVLAETDSSGNIQAYYVYGLGLISRIAADGTRNIYHYNNRGDTIALTDNNENVTDAYVYDEFGQVLNSTGAIQNPFKFVGKYGVMDEGNDFYFMRARYYDARTGRFISEDPLGFEGGDWNLYAYVGGNPIIGIDPEGLIKWEKALNKLKEGAKKIVQKATDALRPLNIISIIMGKGDTPIGESLHVGSKVNKGINIGSDINEAAQEFKIGETNRDIRQLCVDEKIQDSNICFNAEYINPWKSIYRVGKPATEAGTNIIW